MIAKINRGADTAGLLRYLLGPGRAEEHTDPHLIASWDGDPAALAPAVVNGRHQVRSLAALLDQPLDALPRRPVQTVWHCSLRNAPGDRRLSDDEWAQAARHVLDHVGLAPVGDGDACRWAAVRHGEDHIHVLATFARQDGVPVRTPHDYRRAGRACQELEQLFDLTGTRDRDSTAVQHPTRAEAEKARRAGRDESARETLRREVRLASMVALEPEAFLDELRSSGLLVRARYSTQEPEQLTGYAVAWPGDRTPGGRPVWFSGSTLAPDLSLPRLQQRWRGVRDEMARRQPPSRLTTQRRTDWTPVLSALARTSAAGEVGDAARLVHAIASALTAVSRVLEGTRGGPSTRSSTRLITDLDRTVGGPGPGSTSELQLLAVAHIALRAGGCALPGGVDAARWERMLLDLLRVTTQMPVAAPQSRHQVAAARALARSRASGQRADPRAASTGEVRGARRGPSGGAVTGGHLDGVPCAETPRLR